MPGIEPGSKESHRSRVTTIAHFEFSNLEIKSEQKASRLKALNFHALREQGSLLSLSEEVSQKPIDKISGDHGER